MNNKRGEKLLSIWWFIVLGIIGVGIVIGVLIFFSSEVDIKVVESQILNDRIANCFFEKGYLNEAVLLENYNIYKDCEINESVFGTGSYFYFNIQIYNSEGKTQLKEPISRGNAALIKDCEIQKVASSKYYPRCSKSETSVYCVGDSNPWKINILTISDQDGERIKESEL